MMVTGVFFFWALFSYHILDLRPVARSEVVDKMSDLYLVVDAKDRLVDYNTGLGGRSSASRAERERRFGTEVDHAGQPRVL